MAILRDQPKHVEAQTLLDFTEDQIAVGNLNQAIQYYFAGDGAKAEDLLRQALHTFSLKTDTPDRAKKLVLVYQFLAVCLLDKYYRGNDPTGKNMQEAEDYIKEIYALQPEFILQEKYFSPKIVKRFAAARQL